MFGHTPPYSCSHFNTSSNVPSWYDDCAKAAGGCLSIKIPTEKEFNIGNTTFGASTSGGTQWCIDHLQGYMYNKVVDPFGAMYYEVDDILSAPNQCRFLVGGEQDSTGKLEYHARVYNNAGAI